MKNLRLVVWLVAVIVFFGIASIIPPGPYSTLPGGIEGLIIGFAAIGVNDWLDERRWIKE